MVASIGDHQLKVLRLIRAAGEITRRDIAGRAGLSPSIVSRVTKELRNQGLVCDEIKSESNGGRPADVLMLRREAGYVIGIAIASNRQQAIVADLRGGVVSVVSEAIPAPGNLEEALAGVESLTDRVLTEAGLGRETILGVGLSLQFIVDTAAGVVYVWPNPATRPGVCIDLPLRDELAGRLPWHHIIVEDTVRALGIAEAQYGHGSRERDFIFVLADAGIGAAIMLDGMPYLGPTRIAGEIGHIAVSDAPIPCKCGNTGCLNSLASVGAIQTYVRQRLNDAPMLSTLGDRDAGPSIENIIGEAERGDKLAYQALNEAGEHLGRGMAMMLNILGPRLAVLGGVLATSDVFLDAVRRTVKLRALPQVSRVASVQRSQLGEFGDCHGAANLVLNALFASGSSNVLALRQRSSQTGPSVGKVPTAAPS
jgi:predicted NBD/HSP70 family sugar kinase